jgi:hypothetical protein
MGAGDMKKVFERLGHDAETAECYAEQDDAEEMVVRSAFLHMLWALVIREDKHVDGEPAWIEEWLRGARKRGEPPKGVAAALQRMLDKGVDPEDLTDVVRAMQWEIIDNVAQLIDGEWISDLRQEIPGLPEFSWRLYQVRVDEDYEAHPLRELTDLHPQLVEVDPSGREGEPRER